MDAKQLAFDADRETVREGATTLAHALARADELDEALMAAIDAASYRPFDDSDRIGASVSAASVALEHGRALRVLMADGLPTAALSLLRLQHEALTRAVWSLYAATDPAIAKLSAPLTKETEAAAGKLPMLADMLKQLADKPGAAQPLIGLLAFKDNNAAALNSFVHGVSRADAPRPGLPRAPAHRRAAQLQRSDGHGCDDVGRADRADRSPAAGAWRRFAASAVCC